MKRPRFLAAILLSWVLLASVAAAEEVLILNSHADAAQARVDLILQAERTIDVAYFIYDDDHSGLAGLYLLREAAHRGVRVRLMVDSQWNKVSGPIMQHLMNEGVEIRLYHRFSLCKPFWWTRRMHDKLVVVDGVHLIAGGRNIEDPYFGLGEDRNYIDRDIYVSGDVAGDASWYFEELWNSRHVDAPPGKVFTRERMEAGANRVQDGLCYVERSPLVDLSAGGQVLAQATTVPSAKFLHDAVAPVRKKPGIRKDLMEFLESAERSVLIETPYLVVTKGVRKLLQELLDRGVSVRILTNSLLTTDNVWPQAGYVGNKKKLVRMGIELWEYTGPESLHSKSVVVDSRAILIGSYNMDPRSEKLNTEIAVVVEDEELAVSLAESMEENLTRSWRIMDSGKPEGQKHRYPGVGFWKQVKVRLVRLILPLVRGQL